jgi:hypothetical protein
MYFSTDVSRPLGPNVNGFSCLSKAMMTVGDWLVSLSSQIPSPLGSVLGATMLSLFSFSSPLSISSGESVGPSRRLAEKAWCCIRSRLRIALKLPCLGPRGSRLWLTSHAVPDREQVPQCGFARSHRNFRFRHSGNS